MVEDFDLIESSFLSYYGIRLRKELSNMTFSEFRTYLGNLGGDTPFMTSLLFCRITASDCAKNCQI
ncbi:hypothetical protein C9771_09355 [Listeria monocytogenes]|nr:hypothetical protein C9771_09355 [Listeria monocytogenes]